ncbi:SDR family NAD(P)-dependent oxidoreductase [Acidisoma cellulosilytica]|uniref:SDR family NAD(P)-dependent oxidoreductase n=1 Tax=Acidisoma cellulosilyticum TaxID=2802395 RepID=A0A963Z5L8_9PROT|nr:SDR family NAD(P)-dependent oxidoreductase [Acidisoma cellulosilyticum]MCB8883264.1 SDR family NAD(P)-dependent oxidoreductase [Acidisoma cellulosilyticum]
MADPRHLLIFGLGYSGAAIGEAAAAAGFRVTGTSRQSNLCPPPGVTLIPFDAAEAAIASATHIVPTAAPAESGDPALARYAAEIAAAPALRWIGFLSSTGVYGDRGGDWVDEGSAARPTSLRARARRAAEEDWAALGAARGIPVDLIRLAGIYGPGRSAFDDLRAGRARRIDKPGHAFGRIHRQDIAEGVLAAMLQADRLTGLRVLNFNDDLPTEPAEVVAEAARLLGVAPPPLIPFADAEAGMSAMGRSFWAESRRVSSAGTQAVLGRTWRYATYREGLAAIRAAETGQP